MTQSIAQFVGRWNGHFCDYDHVFGAQCVDLADEYMRDVWGIPAFYVTGAVDLYGHRPDLIDWIPNQVGNPAQHPVQGDMVVWHLDAKIGTGIYGHVGIWLDGDGYSFRSFDQNWPVGAPCHLVRHSYEGVKGWGRLRRRAATGSSVAPPNPAPASPPVTAPPVTPTPPPSIPAADPAPIEPPPPISSPPVDAGPAAPPVEVPPVAITPPPAVDPGPPVEIPEPPPIAEAGVSTSEWKVLVAYAVQLAGGATGALIASIGGHVDGQTLQILGGVEVFALAGAATWIIGRSIRKIGTSA